MGHKLSDDFLMLFCEKNSNGTKYLRLKGNELYQRIGTRLKPKDMYTVANFLNKHDDIVTLNLCYNNIGDQGLTILANYYFSKENNMEHINLMHCDIRNQGLNDLSSSKYLKLKKCRLTGNKLGTVSSRYIAQLIQNCPSLISLDIGETDQTQESIDAVLIVTEKSALQYFNMSRIIPNSFYSKYNTAALADDLSTLISLNSNLTELHMQKCEFCEHDMEILLEGLKRNHTLLMLDLACNRIADTGVELISDWLRLTKPQLRGLNVSANYIHNTGARSLSYALPYSKIRFLDITNNRIKNVGMENILYTLKKSCMLRLFFFWGNSFGPKINQMIHRMLQSSVLEQECIDVKIYFVDGVPTAAYYPVNHYKQKYYCVMDFGCADELKIKRNVIPPADARPRPLLEFDHSYRYPAFETSYI